MIKRLALSGQLRTGKNWVAEFCGYPILGFSDPIYKIVEHFCGTYDKNVPGVRSLMQKIGQWGWGKIDDDYPWTVERFGMDFEWVNWTEFGKRNDFWVNIMLTRARHFDKVAVVNVRFEHEIVPLVENDFVHYHVMCSEKTRKERMKKEKFSKATLNDASEHFALQCNKSLPPSRIIWNDTRPMPKKRFLTVSDFKKIT